ncbi:MAG: DUF1648 domain-containing protein [Flavobacteriaceae bacterium]|nr:DUF1648 domain-containing protein [Flavobacteriaceae bacterium]
MNTEKLDLKRIDYGIIFSAIATTLLAWVYVFVKYSKLPNQIPSHFNAKGIVDDYSEKYYLWIVLLVFSALQIFIYLIAKNTSIHNFRLKTKLANFRAIIVFTPLLGCLLLFIIHAIIQSSKGDFEYNSLIIPVIFGLTIITLIIMFSIILKSNKA